jgi:hypothetical protein
MPYLYCITSEKNNVACFQRGKNLKIKMWSSRQVTMHEKINTETI